jgi:hypothetical protein
MMRAALGGRAMVKPFIPADFKQSADLENG